MSRRNKRKPILAEPDQRYWRRRANRQVRKRRLTRNLLRWSALVLANGAIATVLVVAGLQATARLLGGDEFDLRGFRIVGAERASEEAIEARLAPYVGHNIFLVNLREIEAAASLDAWVLDASAKRVLPDTLRLRLVEREPVAAAVIHDLAHLVDASGYVIGPTGSAADDLPVITGLNRFEGDELAGALRRGVGMLGRLRADCPAFAARISEIDLSRPGRVTARTLDGGPPLWLDPERVERNVSRWLELAGAIEERAGELAYADLRWSHRITVKPFDP